VRGGMARDDAYRVVQRAAQRALEEARPLRELIATEPAIERLQAEGEGALDLDQLFDPAHYVRYAEELVGRLDRLEQSSGGERPRD
jgi:adenylosuccinate lyase